MNHAKLKVIAAILLVFFMGVAAGGLASHIYSRHRFEKLVRKPAAFLFPRFMEKIGNELALTPEQRKKAAEILGDLEESLFEFRRRHAGELDAIIDRHFQLLKDMLTPEQQAKLEDFQYNFQRLRKRWLRPHGRFGPPRGRDARQFQRRLKERLALSDDAWTEVRPIIQRDFRRKRRLFRRHWKEDLPEAELKKRLAAIASETEQALARILTPEQMAAFRDAQEAFNERRADHRPPPPPEAPLTDEDPMHEAPLDKDGP
jgi:hypothetical protein